MWLREAAKEDKIPLPLQLSYVYSLISILGFLGYIESFTFNILDNYELTNPMLVTKLLSYFHIIKNQEISVVIENLMRDRLFILFLNHRFAYALFDKFENMTKPIPVYD